jgi:hypothetical protein
MCSCNKKKFKVRLPGGLEVPKNTEEDAKKFAAKHPGAKVIKPSTS